MPAPRLQLRLAQLRGAPLTRLELRVFLNKWLRRMPDVRLATDFVPERRGGPAMTPERLPIE